MKANLIIIQEFSQHLKLGGKSPATVESYCRDSEQFMNFLSRHAIALEQVESSTLLQFKESIIQSDKENSIRRKIIGIRQFFRYLKSSRRIASTPFDDVPIPARNEILLLENLTPRIETVMASYLNAKSSSLKPSRDAAVLYLIGREGIKANELINLKWQDFWSGHPHSTLHIAGSKARTIALDEETTVVLNAYFDQIKKFSSQNNKADLCEYMFIAFKGRDCYITMPRLTRHGLKFALYEIGERHNLPHFNAEGLRHFAIHWHLSKGVAAEQLSQHLGLRQLGNISKHIGYLHKINIK